MRLTPVFLRVSELPLDDNSPLSLSNVVCPAKPAVVLSKDNK
jgi:hypothetical protein